MKRPGRRDRKLAEWTARLLSCDACLGAAWFNVRASGYGANKGGWKKMPCQRCNPTGSTKPPEDENKIPLAEMVTRGTALGGRRRI